MGNKRSKINDTVMDKVKCC